MCFPFTQDQANAFAMFNTGSNIFLTGDSGTGKSSLVKEMILKAHDEGRSVAVTASTGLAASLLPGGRTIHSLLKAYPFTDLNTVDFKEKSKNLDGIDLLIIDEISMLGKHFIPFLFTCLETSERKIQLIVVGDFFQLPPVKDDYAFKSSYWNWLKLEPCILHEVVRQKNEEMVYNLNKLKYGDASCIPYFMSHSSTSFFKDQITICSRRESVKSLNQMKLEQIAGRAYTYTAYGSGKTIDGFAPIEKDLVLKEGARVMATVNGEGFCNGSLGIVTNLQCDSIDVLFDSGREISIFRRSFESGKLDKDGNKTFIQQFPLRLAYAMTIHKAQGQTFKYVNIDASSCFASGQLYVAASRAESIEHIHFINPINSKCIKTDPSVIQFYKKLAAISEIKQRGMAG